MKSPEEHAYDVRTQNAIDEQRTLRETVDRMETATANNTMMTGEITFNNRPPQVLTATTQMLLDAAAKARGMGMNEYQKLAEVTVVYPLDLKVIYPTIGLAGETGEVCEKVKKWIRDADRQPLTDEQRDLLKKELGDVLWYLAVLAKDLGLSLDDIARHNIEKLHDRKGRGVVHGKGDTR